MRKPKNASSFRKPKEENVAVSSQKADFPVSHMKEISVTPLFPLSLPYLSKKRNKRVSAMVMRTPPQRGILGQRLKWEIKEKKRNSKKKTLPNNSLDIWPLEEQGPGEKGTVVRRPGLGCFRITALSKVIHSFKLYLLLQTFRTQSWKVCVSSLKEFTWQVW